MRVKNVFAAIVGIAALATAIPATAGEAWAYRDDNGNTIYMVIRCTHSGDVYSEWGDPAGPWTWIDGPAWVETPC